MQYSTTEGARGICPIGFHIPTDAEWHTLEKNLVDGGATCSASRNGNGCAPAGAKTQPGGSSLFEVNLAGFNLAGSTSNRDTLGILWSSSPVTGNAWYRLISSGDSSISRGSSVKDYGLSVRCLQD